MEEVSEMELPIFSGGMEGSRSSSNVMGGFKLGGSTCSSTLSDTANTTAPPVVIKHQPLLDIDAFNRTPPRAHSAAESMDLYEKIVCGLDSDSDDQEWDSTGLRILPVQFPITGRWEGYIKAPNTPYSLVVDSFSSETNSYKASHCIPSIAQTYISCILTVTGDKIHIEDGLSVFTGKLHSNSGEIKGTLMVKGEKRLFELVKEGGRKNDEHDAKIGKPPKHPTFVSPPAERPQK